MSGNVPNVSYTSFNWAKLYDQVVLQQGVPIPDNDWNELDSIALANLMMVSAHALGDMKLPATLGGVDGYQIEQYASPANDFTISAGWMLMEGVLVPSVWGDPPTAHQYESDTNLICSGEIATVSSPNIIDVDKFWTTSYDLVGCRVKMTSGAESGNSFAVVSLVGATELELSGVGSIAPGDTYIIKPPALTTPGGARTDEVYLAVWWEDINDNEDSAIVNPGLGVESSHRSQRRWCVRVEEAGTTPASSTVHGFGFRYKRLAVLSRTATSTINNGMIVNDEFASPLSDISPQIRNWLNQYLAEPVIIAQSALTPLATGTHDGGNGQTNLTDSGESWTPDEWQDRTVGDTTEGFTAKISTNTGTVATCINQLGGSDRLWDNGDAYKIYDNAFQLTGDFYVGKGAVGTASDFFAIRDKDDPGKSYYPGGIPPPVGRASGYVFKVYDSTNTTELIPSSDADDQGFYTDPYLRAYRSDWADYEAPIDADCNIACFQKVLSNALEDEPTYAFPYAGLMVRERIVSGMRMRQLDGSPDKVSAGYLASALEDLLGFVNDRVRKDDNETITGDYDLKGEYTFNDSGDSKGSLWVSKWIGVEASIIYQGTGTVYNPQTTADFGLTNNAFGYLIDDAGDRIFFSLRLPAEYQTGERLVIESVFRLKNAETASDKIYARLYADIFTQFDTTASVSDIRNVAHNIQNNNAANTIHKVTFIVDSANINQLDTCKFSIMDYDIVSGEAVSEVYYLGSTIKYRASRIAQKWTSWPSES